MTSESSIKLIAIDALQDQVRALRQAGARLVQIGAAQLPNILEVTYSFDLDGRLTSLRLHLSPENPWLPSISSIYWCAFLYENELHDLFKIQVDDMAVDFHGTLYTTAVKFAFGQTKPPQAPKVTAARPGVPPGSNPSLN